MSKTNCVESVGVVLDRVIREISEPATKEKPINIETWGEWFQFQTLGDPQLEAMLRAASRFILDVKEGVEGPWLVLLGTSGAGKSHLAKRVWRWWTKSGQWYVHNGTGANLVKTGQFCLWADYVQECREGDFSRTSDLISDDLVVLDDIGAGTDGRKWMADKLYHILEKRLDEGKATMLTANLSLEQLAEAYEVRITSRLIRRGVDKVVDVDVPDYKLRRLT